MREAIFQTEIKYSIIEQNGWCEKFPDMPKFKTESRFIPTKPFDLIGVYNSIPFGIECKMLPFYKAFAPSMMRDNQKESLDNFAIAGGKSFVFLNVRTSRKIKPYTNHLIVFEWNTLKKLWNNGSILKKDLELVPYIMGKRKRFNMNSFYKYLK